MKTRRAVAAFVGMLIAAMPALAAAADGNSRTLPPSPHAYTVMAFTFGALALLLLIAAIGWLYEQRRGLHWDFQNTDAGAHGADEHH